MYAARDGRVDIVRELLDADADTERRDVVSSEGIQFWMLCGKALFLLELRVVSMYLTYFYILHSNKLVR